MKLLRFERDGGTHFGFVRGDAAVSFARAQSQAGVAHPELASVEAWLAALPKSLDLAREVAARSASLAADAPLAQVRIRPPVPRPPALFDFGLSPRHLRNSALTLLRHELGAPVRALLSPLLRLAERRLRGSSAMPYYKGNHNAVIGDDDLVGWPAFTSYLDVEPELALVTGNEAVPLAGYTILNDASARDVQWPEMFGSGPARCKDFDRSNGLGPFLVTPDEVPDPLALDVEVTVGTRFTWHGSTREYVRHPEEVVRHLRSVLTPLPGTVIGMGTIPDCTGLDHDQWLHPGDAVAIRFEELGTLRQRIPPAPPDLAPSRWRERPELRAAPSDTGSRS